MQPQSLLMQLRTSVKRHAIIRLKKGGCTCTPLHPPCLRACDIQISKSGWNKDREVDVLLSDKTETLMYRIASCNGVKVCPDESCDYAAPISAQRPCSIHNNLKLVKSNDKAPCPVQFAYLYPKDASDHRRWIFAFVRHQKGACDSLHNHPIASYIAHQKFAPKSSK